MSDDLKEREESPEGREDPEASAGEAEAFAAGEEETPVGGISSDEEPMEEAEERLVSEDEDAPQPEVRVDEDTNGAEGPEEYIVEDEEETTGAIPTTGAGEGLVRALAQLRQAHKELEETEERAKSADDRFLRLGAEFENYRKRVTRERDDDKKYANEKILKELLPVVDNMERAIAAAEGSSDAQLLSGVQMVLKQILDVLKRFGATQFSALNESFDPERHEAMQQVETEEVAPGTVVTEYMKGFTLNERLLRPAMVVVAKAPPTEADEGGDGVAGAELPPGEQGD